MCKLRLSKETKNCALITDIAFWEVGNGQNARILALYDFLSKQCALTLYYLGDDPPPFPCVALDKNSPCALATLLRRARHELIIVEKLHLAWIADLDVGNSPLYLDAHDLISQRAKSFERFGRSCSTLTFQEEIALFSKFDKVMLLQREDVATISPFLEKQRLLLCPHPVVADEDIPIKEVVESIGFFGGPSWPNIDAIQWFHDYVLPLLGELSEKCAVHGSINCSPFSQFLPRLAFKSGLIPSLAEYYKQTDIAINPALYGSGLKIKTVEAIAHGIPLVTTSVGAEGLLELKDRCFLLADTAEEFALRIKELSSCKATRERLSRQGKAFAKEHFTPEACFSYL